MGKVGSALRMLGLTALLVLTLIAGAMLVVNAQPQIPFKTPVWSSSDKVIDLAVSADGNIIAVAVLEGQISRLKVYNASGNLLWSFGGESIFPKPDLHAITAVDVSDDGNVVIAAIYLYYGQLSPKEYYYLLFWKNAGELSGNPLPNWSSVNLWGLIGRGLIAVSSDGNQVVAAHFLNVSYWNSTLTLSGSFKQSTWYDDMELEFKCADISDDGNIVAILGRNLHASYALVYRGCKSRSGSENFDLLYDRFGKWERMHMALSDNGQYVVVGFGNTTTSASGKIFFFNTTMSGSWEPQWTYEIEDEWVTAVDISGDGDTVVAVTNLQGASPSRLLIFRSATSKTGLVSADYEFNEASSYTNHDYFDVSVDGLGEVAVGGTGDYVFAVNATTGELLWYYNGIYPRVSSFVKVSKDGSAVVTAGRESDSLYYFSVGTAVVTFNQSGVGSDYTGPVLNVDGVNYSAADLPKSFTWVVGSNHTFEFYESLYVNANERYGWIRTEGLSTYCSGEIIVPSGGGVVNGIYTKQYLVIITASPSEVMGGTFRANFTSGGLTFYGKTGRTPYYIWANAGTWVNVTEPQPIIDSYEFSHYSPSSNVYVNGSKIITLVYTKPKPPVGGVIVSPEENLAVTPNSTATTIILAIILISTLGIAAKKKTT
ncbi:MAG: hypothetical protein QXS05_08795 [Candidatus Bathyarchaeia archaeon]